MCKVKKDKCKNCKNCPVKKVKDAQPFTTSPHHQSNK